MKRLSLVYLDTHVTMWLYDGLVERLSPAATSAIETGSLMLGGMAELELQYLFEIRRIRPTGGEIVNTLAEEVGLKSSEVAFGLIVRKAGELSWARGPFDRLICAEALVAGGRLISQDETILEHCRAALW